MSGFDRDHVLPAPSSATPVRQHDASTAQPLAKGVRDKMEGGFGHDFSAVRVHSDRESAEQARGMGAQAFTLGRDVHFGAGRYRPQNEQGEHLLAHELAHVVQQERGGMSDQSEQRADAAAARVMDGEAVSPALLGGAVRSVQMKPDDSTKLSAEASNDKPAADPGSWSKTLDRFGHNSAALAGGHRKAIQELAAEIAARVGLIAGSRATITISGHTDTSGDEKYNEGLGLKRANAAKAALEAALAKKKLGADRIAGITAESAGEANPAKQTGDDIKEPLNRRVDILVKIEGPLPSSSTTPEVPSPDAEPEKKPIDLNLPRNYKPPEPYGPRRPPGENSWEKMDENQRKLDQYDKKNPRKPKSLNDVLVDGVTKALEPVIKLLPKSLRDKARDGIRAGIEKGTEAGCDAAIDATGVTGEEADAIKAACKAALKTKPGGGNK